MTLASIIHYCTNDYRFIGKCIAEARLFSDQIVVPICDHFFNGQPENRYLMERTYAEHPDCTFIEFSFTPGKLYSPYSTQSPADPGWIRLWHGISRYIGFLYSRSEMEFLLFLDSDEIVEGARMAEWIATGEHRNWKALRFLAYYYALRPTLKSKKLQNLVLLAKKDALEPRFFRQVDERHGLYQYIEEPKIKEVLAPDRRPFIHHYSWVRPSQECFQKAGTWGHKEEKNWKEEIEKAFQQKGFRDLFGNVEMEFEEIEKPYFDPLSVKIPIGEASLSQFPNVIRVGPREVFLKELELCHGDCYSH